MATHSPRRRPRSLKESLLRNKWLFINIACSILVAIGLATWILNRDSGTDDDNNSPNGDPTNKKRANPNDHAGGRPNAKTGLCRVYTKEPGYFVFINGEPVRGTGDEWITTPCAVTLQRGGQEITVVKRGVRDQAKYVDVGEDTKVVFDESEPASVSVTGLLDAAYLNTKTDAPISLFQLNTEQKELDPFITPDGLTLLFVSDRTQDGEKAIYQVSRKSRYAFFSETPKRVTGTSSLRMPASPTLTSDSLNLVYTLPRLGTVNCVPRSSALGEFETKRPLVIQKQASAQWLSAQLIRDGDRAWRFYGLLKERGRRNGYTASARKSQERNNSFRNDSNKALLPPTDPGQEFGRPQKFDLGGSPPCLSRDGQRQYFFDGKFLKRSVRSSLSEPFGNPQLLVSFSGITNYQPTVGRRSYFITDDEQWLIYESNADLHMVRVFSRPRQALLITGRSIPPLPVKVAKVPNDTSQKKKVDEPFVPKVDPRTIPLGYPIFRKKLIELLKDRKYDEARRHVQSGLRDATLKADRELVEWDREDTNNAAAFWNDFDKAAAKMKPGEEFLAGPVRMLFVKYDQGEFFATVNGKPVRKQSRLMKLSDAVRIVDKQLGRDDADVQKRLATFWFYDKDGSPASAFARFARAKKAAETFQERLAQRRLKQAQHEFARKNIGKALEIVGEITKTYPKSKAATAGRKLVDKAYAAVTWNEIGGRTWVKKDGAYTAPDNGRKAGAMLRSPDQYENFELRLEWKSDAPNGQGGVYFRYPGSGNPVDTGFKLQLSDDANGVVDRFCTGSLFKVQAPTSNAVKPQGQWNTLLLRVRGESVTAVINGTKVLDTKATSKTIPLKGFVALDGVLGGITYRKTLLIELPAASPSP